MAIQTVNLGTYANDGTGDDLRVAFQKVNENFSELDNLVITGASNLGSGSPVFAGKAEDPGTGDLLTFRSIEGGQNILVSHDGTTISITTSPTILADLIGNTTGFHTGDVNGNILRDNSPLYINSVDTSTYDYTPLYINSLIISGNNLINSGITTISTYVGDGLVINSDVQLVLQSNNGVLIDTDLTVSNGITGNLTGNVLGDTTGLHTGNVVGNVTGDLTGGTTGTHTGNVIGNVTGNLTGDSFGTHTGNVIGNVTGNVSGNAGTVTNGVYTTSSINVLADVDTVSTPPSSGQALVWSGTVWRPGTVSTGGGSGNLDFGTFLAPAGFTLDLGSF